MLEEALAEYYEATLIEPTDLDLQIKVVSLYAKMNREERVAQRLTILRKKFPKSGEVQFQSGSYHLRRDELDKALEYYKKAIELAPDLTKSYNNVGVIYMQKEDFGRAIAAFEQALRKNSNHQSAHLNLGLIFDQNAPDPARAAYHYQRYIDLGGPRAAEVKQWIKELPAE